LSTWLLAGAGFGALAALLLAGVPIAFAMIIVGVAGSVSILGLEPALALLGQIPVSQAAS
jgi:C4-dicarboxylate transporter DctM subunit